MSGGNLSKITIDEYILKIKKNFYPLIQPNQTNLQVLENNIFLKRVDQAAKIKLELPVLFGLLDFFNSEFGPCNKCNIPYFFKSIEDHDYCIFCYIILYSRPITFYLNFNESDELLSINMHLVNTSISQNLLNKIYTCENPSNLNQIIDNFYQSQSSKNRSLDEFM